MSALIFKSVKGIAIAMVILGIVHVVVTPIIIQQLAIANASDKAVFIFMGVVAGFAVILPGLVVLNQLSLLRNGQKNAFSLLVLCDVNILIIGMMAIFFMPDNPFAYITMLLGILLLIPLRRIKQEVQRQTT